MAKKIKIELSFNEYVSIDARAARVYAWDRATSPSIQRSNDVFVMEFRNLKETVSREVSLENINKAWIAFVEKCNNMEALGK